MDKNIQSTMIPKLKFVQNSAMINTIIYLDTIIFDPKEVLEIIDLRSLGYYKVKQGILQLNLRKYYRFKKKDILCEQFKKFINTLKKERKVGTKEKYLCLNMTDREILEKIKRFREIFFNRKREKGSNGYAIYILKWYLSRSISFMTVLYCLLSTQQLFST